MRPIPLDGLVGDTRALVRERLEGLADELITSDRMTSRVEALRLIAEELRCLEAKERSLVLLVRGWGEAFDLGLLSKTKVRQPSTCLNFCTRLP
jgi:hypothetical protein